MTSRSENSVLLNFQDWRNRVVKELKQKGFKVDFINGWPIVREPLTMIDKMRLLDLELTVEVKKIIDSEGMIFGWNA
jgi:hypothetical protein